VREGYTGAYPVVAERLAIDAEKAKPGRS